MATIAGYALLVAVAAPFLGVATLTVRFALRQRRTKREHRDGSVRIAIVLAEHRGYQRALREHGLADN